MTPKERVLVAFHFQIPDRVPIDYLANPGIDRRLKDHFGFEKNDDESLRQRLGVDFRQIFTPYKGPRLHEERPDRQIDPEFGIHMRYIEHQSGGYWDYCDFPLQFADEETVKNWPMPSPDDYDYDAVVETCRKHSDYGLSLGGPGLVDTINSTGMIRNMEQVLVDLALDEPAGLLYMDRRLAIQHEVIRRSLEAAQGKIDFLWIGEDLGTQNSPLISLEMFRKHIRSRLQQFVDLGQAYNLPVMIHSCGSSSWAYNDFIDMGVTAVDTLQPEAKNMSPAYLKETFGGKLAFHGCISTAGPVASGSVQDTVENAQETLDIMMPGGGYCFSPTHALQDNSPTENVVAMYETARQHGVYAED